MFAHAMPSALNAVGQERWPLCGKIQCNDALHGQVYVDTRVRPSMSRKQIHSSQGLRSQCVVVAWKWGSIPMPCERQLA